MLRMFVIFVSHCNSDAGGAAPTFGADAAQGGSRAREWFSDEQVREVVPASGIARRCGLLGRTFERQFKDNLSLVVGDPDGRGPVENLVPGKIVRDFLGVIAGGVIVGQFRPEAVEDR